MARQKKPEPVILPDLALTSFSDMMTLMLTFFVLLFSMSEIRKPRVEATMKAMMMQMGLQPQQSSPVMTFTPSQRISQSGPLRTGPPGENPEVRTIREDQRVKQVLGASALFDPGTAILTPTGRNLLREQLAPELRGFTNRIEVSGYTGDADAGAFEARRTWEEWDPWRLGAERAYAVMRYLVEDCGLEEKRFVIQSGAGFQPSDTSGFGRVEVVMSDYPVTNR